MNPAQVLLPAGLTTLVLASITAFYVAENKKTIKSKFDETVHSDYQPDIHFNNPFVNNIKTYDGRVLTLKTKSEQLLTSEKNNLTVNSSDSLPVKKAGLFYITVGSKGKFYVTNPGVREGRSNILSSRSKK